MATKLMCGHCEELFDTVDALASHVEEWALDSWDPVECSCYLVTIDADGDVGDSLYQFNLDAKPKTVDGEDDAECYIGEGLRKRLVEHGATPEQAGIK